MNNPQTVKKAVYEVYDPSMSGATLLDGRSDLKYPVVMWVKAIDRPGWNRCSPIIELSLAKRWYGYWGKTCATFAISPAHQISRTVQLPIL